MAKDPVFIETSEIKDRASLLLFDKLIPVSIGASDWVDYNFFNKGETPKVYDSVYVANTTQVKRVHRYLEAINAITKMGVKYKGALVCGNWGGRKEEVISIHKHYKLSGRCDLFFELNPVELRTVLWKSKVDILLSYKEGSNRSLFEALFCNIPVMVLEENIGVNKSYINEFTGKVINDDLLEIGLLKMCDGWRKYRPRNWAIKNITPEITTKKLCSIIRNQTGENPVDSKNDKTLIKVNRPEIEYMNYTEFNKCSFNAGFLELFMKEENDIDTKVNGFKDLFRVKVNKKVLEH